MTIQNRVVFVPRAHPNVTSNVTVAGPNPTGLGTTFELAKFVTATSAAGGLPSGVQRANIVIPDLGRKFCSYQVDIIGYSYGMQSGFRLLFGGYSTPSGVVRTSFKDLQGNVPVMGTYMNSNGDGTIFFEVHNSYPAFVANMTRLLYDDDFAASGNAVQWTLAGTQI